MGIYIYIYIYVCHASAHAQDNNNNNNYLYVQWIAMVYPAKVCNGLREASALMRISSLNLIAERLSARLMIAH